MSTPLFSNIPYRDSEIAKIAKFTKIASLAMCVVIALIWIVGLCEGEYSTENAILFSIAPVCSIFLFAYIYADAVCRKRQSLLVYDDRILWRQGLSNKEWEIRLAPSAYKIKVKKYVSRGGATIHLIFMDQNNHRLLRYITPYSTQLSQRLKYQLQKIGCEIIGPKNGF